MSPRWWMPIALLAAWAGPALAQGKPAPPSFHAGLSAAYEAGAKDGALILLVFGSERCGPCQMLKKETLDAPEFLEHGGPLHVVKVDVDTSAGMARDFKVNAIPHLALLSADGRIISQRVGFLTAGDLMGWVAEGRRRAEAGIWEGTAPDTKVAAFVGRLSTEAAGDDELKRLVQMSGDPDPATRSLAQKVLAGQREAAVACLMEGVSDGYLGVRIGAAETLEKMLPGMPAMDPWAPPSEREKSVASARKWWTETGKRLPPPAPPQADVAVERSIEGALAAALSEDPVRRTEGMSALVRIGDAALPSVREQIRRCERRLALRGDAGDQKALWALEDVRWAILIPDAVEARVGGARHALGRGASQERQAATLRLAQAGNGAIPALTELVADPDALVKETALHALAEVNGSDVLLPMASLLKAPDSNLRMTAAQLLGRTKKAAAAKHLVTVLADPDELVACAAIAALEEVKAAGERDALVACLSDTRWRVRAAAAEVIGKLKVLRTSQELTALLDDPDSFVVKSALEALKATNVPPDAEKLRAVVKRLPTLGGIAAEILIQDPSLAALERITRIYDETDNEGRAAILDGLSKDRSPRGIPRHPRDSGAPDTADSEWKPLLSKALASTDAEVRRRATGILGGRAAGLAAELVTPLLEDGDPEIRATAAGVVCRIVAYHWGVRGDGTGTPQYGILEKARTMAEAPKAGDEPSVSGKPTPPVARPAQGDKAPSAPKAADQVEAILKRHAEWRRLLLKHAGPTPDPRVIFAVYAIGDGRSDLPPLERLLERPTLQKDMDNLEYEVRNAAISMLVKRMPPPAGQPVLERLLQTPFLYARVLSRINHGVKDLRDYVLDPDRVVSVMNKAGTDDLRTIMDVFLGSARSEGVSLAVANERTDAILKKLLESSNPRQKAVGVLALASRDDPKSLAPVEQASKDPNPWVRRAALMTIIARTEDRKQLEERLRTFLLDPSIETTSAAALGLLSPEIAAASGMDYRANSLAMGNVRAYAGFWNDIMEKRRKGPYAEFDGRPERPPVPLPDRPDFLPKLRERLNAKLSEEEEEHAGEILAPIALLLAQCGDSIGLDRLLEIRRSGGKRYFPERAILTAIALSRNPKYVPTIRQMAEEADKEQRLREALMGLRGMSGPDARALRREINKRLAGLEDQLGGE